MMGSPPLISQGVHRFVGYINTHGGRPLNMQGEVFYAGYIVQVYTDDLQNVGAWIRDARQRIDVKEAEYNSATTKD